MQFGGIQKSTLLDYPGKVSSVLFLTGCNFDCPYCHNPELAKGLLKKSSSLEEEEIFCFLETRKCLLDGVVISGGEPTLNKRLPFLCEKIKHKGYAVKLDTNGSRPGVIKNLVDHGLVDYIAMDIKTDPSCYPPYITKESISQSILKSIRIIMEAALPYEFRTTCVAPLVDVAIVKKIAKAIKGAMLYALQRLNKERILHPDFFSGNKTALGEQGLLELKRAADPWVTQCIIR